LNAIIGITSYYRVILKLVILHDVTNSKWGFCVLKKKEKKRLFPKKTKISDLKKEWRVVFF